MVPTQNLAYVAQAAGFTISQYAQQVIIPGLIKTLAQELQTLENAIFSVLNKMTLAAQPLGGGNWDILDKLGAIVGEPRNGRADADYLPAIRLRVRVNKSDGLCDDILQITNLISPGPVYLEYPTAGFEVYLGVQAATVVNALLANLGKAKGAGIAAYVRSAAGSSVLVPSDRVSGTLGTGFPDFVSGGFPNAPVSLTVVVGS